MPDAEARIAIFRRYLDRQAGFAAEGRQGQPPRTI
jgi:hypothetical protein